MADKPDSVEERLAALERFCFGGEPSPDCPLCKGKGTLWRAPSNGIGRGTNNPCVCTKGVLRRAGARW